MLSVSKLEITIREAMDMDPDKEIGVMRQAEDMACVLLAMRPDPPLTELDLGDVLNAMNQGGASAVLQTKIHRMKCAARGRLLLKLIGQGIK